MTLPRRCLAALFAAIMLPLLVAVPAQAYPDTGPDVEVSGSTLVGGRSVSFSAGSGDVPCESWTATFLDQTASGPSSTTFSHTFTTPSVKKRTVSELTVTCFFADSSQPFSRTVEITLLPDGDAVSGVDTGLDDASGNAGGTGLGSLLPDTGGQSAWILIGGALLVLVGGGALLVARRRSS